MFAFVCMRPSVSPYYCTGNYEELTKQAEDQGNNNAVVFILDSLKTIHHVKRILKNWL